jgi:hypothetical protein
MKDPQIQKRYFILSSFTRLGLTINTDVYRFADKLIQENCTFPTSSLEEVDVLIKKYYEDYMGEQRWSAIND